MLWRAHHTNLLTKPLMNSECIPMGNNVPFLSSQTARAKHPKLLETKPFPWSNSNSRKVVANTLRTFVTSIVLLFGSIDRPSYLDALAVSFLHVCICAVVISDSLASHAWSHDSSLRSRLRSPPSCITCRRRSRKRFRLETKNVSQIFSPGNFLCGLPNYIGNSMIYFTITPS